MKKDFIIDYLGYLLVKLLGPVIRRLPIRVGLFFGKAIGDGMYYLDYRRRARVYANLKTAFCNLKPSELNTLTKRFYQNFGQSIIEVFFIPLVDERYIKKYISIEGVQHIKDAFNKGKGVIFLGMHEGSWELSNVISAQLGFSFNLFVRNQRYPRLNNILNSYRLKKGCRIIQRQGELRQLISSLRNNEAIGMTMDQGGRSGVFVDFFGKEASMATGAVRLALKYDAVILPGFYARVKGPYLKLMILAPFKLKRGLGLAADIRNNLQELTRIFEGLIADYPAEYLWTYKIWKYSKTRDILILDDGKTGHLRQSQGLAKIISDYLKGKGMTARIVTVKLEFKGRFSLYLLALSVGLSGKYKCQGCLWCLRRCLTKDAYRDLLSIKPDIIISCGASAAGVNYVLSRDNYARSIVIMRPSFLSVRRFDLAIIPEHDSPPLRKNVLVTKGALNLIDEKYLKEQGERLSQASGIKCQASGNCIGLLVGGDTKDFSLSREDIFEVIKQVKTASKKFHMDILATTSRRTSTEIEGVIKQELKGYPDCKLLVIANERNVPEAVGGILALSRFVIVSPESISMISEAASSGKYIIVFKSYVSNRHNRFLNNLAMKRYIYLCEPTEIYPLIEELSNEQPPVNILDDALKVKKGLIKVI